MAEIPIKPGRTEIQLTARGRASEVVPELLEVPGGLYPLMSAAFEVDEYRIQAGWPVPVPDGDIRVECMVSAEGDLLTVREQPTSVVTAADMRWVADVNYYDQTALQWSPIQSDVSPWQTSTDHAPSLITDYEYQIGDERWVGMTALNFDSNTGDYMWINLDLAMGGTEGYTVIMVMCPNSIYGNDPDVLDNALWGPEVTEGGWASFTVTDRAVYMATDAMPAQKGVPLANPLESTAPSYLALVVGRPQTTLYAGSGPSNVQMKTLVAGPAAVPLNTRFWLGNAPSITSGTMDMALLDLSMYGNPLKHDEVMAEFAELSKVYGGDT